MLHNFQRLDYRSRHLKKGIHGRTMVSRVALFLPIQTCSLVFMNGLFSNWCLFVQIPCVRNWRACSRGYKGEVNTGHVLISDFGVCDVCDFCDCDICDSVKIVINLYFIWTMSSIELVRAFKMHMWWRNKCYIYMYAALPLTPQYLYS